MTVFHVRSLLIKPLVGFTNNAAQMSSIMGLCAMCMFDQGQFKVMVIVQRLTLYDLYPLQILITQTTILRN